MKNMAAQKSLCHRSWSPVFEESNVTSFPMKVAITGDEAPMTAAATTPIHMLTASGLLICMMAMMT